MRWQFRLVSGLIAFFWVFAGVFAETVPGTSVASFRDATIPIFRDGANRPFGILRLKSAALERESRGFFRIAVLRKPVIRGCDLEVEQLDDVLLLLRKLKTAVPALPNPEQIEFAGFSIRLKNVSAPLLSSESISWSQDESTLLFQNVKLPGGEFHPTSRLILSGPDAGSFYFAPATSRPFAELLERARDTIQIKSTNETKSL